MPRLPRTDMTLAQMDALIESLMNPDWLERAIFFEQRRPDILRIAVRAALACWSHHD